MGTGEPARQPRRAPKPETPLTTDTEKQLLVEVSELRKQLDIVQTAHTTSIKELAYERNEKDVLRKEVDWLRGEIDRSRSEIDRSRTNLALVSLDIVDDPSTTLIKNLNAEHIAAVKALFEHYKDLSAARDATVQVVVGSMK
jgi:hypothetical protein